MKVHCWSEIICLVEPIYMAGVEFALYKNNDKKHRQPPNAVIHEIRLTFCDDRRYSKNTFVAIDAT